MLLNTIYIVLNILLLLIFFFFFNRLKQRLTNVESTEQEVS